MDESFTARATGKSYGALIHEDHWLYYTLEKTWTSFAGTSEWALRFPSVVAAAASAALVTALGTRLLNRRAGIIAGLLVAANPFVVTWGQQARSYTFLLLLAVASTVALVRVLDSPTRRNWAVYGTSVALLLVWQPLGGLILPAHVLATVARRRRPSTSALLATYLVAGLLVSPWVAAVAVREARGGPTTWLEDPALNDVASAAIWVSGPLLLGLALGVVGGLTVLRERAAWVAGLLIGWAALPFLVACAVSLATPIFLDRYLITTAPAFALLAAAALSAVRLPAAVVAGAVAIGITVVQLAVWYGHDSDTDWRRASAYVEAVRKPSDRVLVAPFWAAPAYAYYAGRAAETRPDGRRVWVLALRGSDTAHPQDAATAVGPRYARRSSRDFGDHLSVEEWRLRQRD